MESVLSSIDKIRYSKLSPKKIYRRIEKAVIEVMKPPFIEVLGEYFQELRGI